MGTDPIEAMIRSFQEAVRELEKERGKLDGVIETFRDTIKQLAAIGKEKDAAKRARLEAKMPASAKAYAKAQQDMKLVSDVMSNISKTRAEIMQTYVRNLR